jgi:hypothetical protein
MNKANVNILRVDENTPSHIIDNIKESYQKYMVAKNNNIPIEEILSECIVYYLETDKPDVYGVFYLSWEDNEGYEGNFISGWSTRKATKYVRDAFEKVISQINIFKPIYTYTVLPYVVDMYLRNDIDIEQLTENVYLIKGLRDVK